MKSHKDMREHHVVMTPSKKYNEEKRVRNKGNKERNCHLSSIFLLALLTLVSCTKVSLQQQNPYPTPSSSLPPVQGAWKLSFTCGNEMFSSDAQFTQSGNQLIGQGIDETGTPWTVEQGSIKGNQVMFVQKYSMAGSSNQLLEYHGKLEWLDEPSYKGWDMTGTYTTMINGKLTSGNWAATPKDPYQMPSPTGTTSVPSIVSSLPSLKSIISSTGPVSKLLPSSGVHTLSGESVPHLSGRYEVNWEFDFKKIHSKMWLEQDGHQIRGHGVDTNTNEKFTIAKGWYHYPQLTIIRQYHKNKGAATTRSITFKAQVTPTTHGPTLKGETQLGGDWEAFIMR